MDCTDAVTFWEITGALSIGIMSGAALVYMLTYYFDARRDEMIMMLQQAWAERNELRKKLQNNE